MAAACQSLRSGVSKISLIPAISHRPKVGGSTLRDDARACRRLASARPALANCG